MTSTPSSTALPQFLTPKEMAAMLHVCRQTVDEFVRRGILPPPSILGRRKLWDRVAVERAIAARRQAV
jgi:predicted DNA-binding transcriptional regulator AlpA